MLKASTAFPFEPAKNYVFEIDTTDYFNSPIKESTMVYHAGGVVSWQPTLLQNMPDSTVYFWRVGKDSIDATGYKWRNSSFQYINGKEGWEQAHFFQFENDEYEFLKHNRATRKFEFSPNVKQLSAKTYGAAEISELYDTKYLIDAGVVAFGGSQAISSLHVGVIDGLTLEPWRADEHNFGQVNYPGTNDKPEFFIFRHDPNISPNFQMESLANMLNDSVPIGHYIIELLQKI